MSIYAVPSEIPDAIPFAADEVHRAYDGEFAQRYWRILAQTERVFTEFRAQFIGKCSPVHFFWGAPDLAVTRFSGRVAPEHPGGVPNLPDRVTREAYSHEVSSCGFWAGRRRRSVSGVLRVCVSIAAGVRERQSRARTAAFFSNDYGEFILPYDAVRTSASPGATLMAFAAIDLRRRRRTRALGPARARTTAGFRAAGQPRRLATGVAPTHAASMRSMPCSSVVEGT